MSLAVGLRRLASELSLLFGCIGVVAAGRNPAAAPRCPEPLTVSLVALVATPDRFHGRCIRTIGYLHLEFEGNGLYIHREDYYRGIRKNGVWINVTLKGGTEPPVNDRYVIVEGIFDGRNHGHMGLWSAAIGEIRRLEPWHRVEVNAAGDIRVDSTGK